MNFKYLISSLLLALLLTCCKTTKPVTQTRIITKTVSDTVYIAKENSRNHQNLLSAVLKDYTIKSDHFPSVGQDYRQKFLILHYTAIDNPTSLRVLTQQSVSAHYLIGDRDDDEIDVLVSEDRRAWHAGVSYWNGRTNLNDSSIGIEIVNPGYSLIDENKIFYPFTDYQIKKVAKLSKNIIERYEIDPTSVLGHSDIAPQRKEDPGAFFPWKKLYEEYKIGAWYDEIDKYYFMGRYPAYQENTSAFMLDFQKELSKYGYQVTEDGIYGLEMKSVTSAFQLHFRPSNYDGTIDKETWAIIKALNKKYRN